MIKICVFDIDPHGACSYYRGIGVLAKLKKLNPEITVQYMEQATWFELADADICFFVRPTEGSFLQAINMAKDLHIPVWIDFDDLLDEIPLCNPSFEYFQGGGLENFKKCIDVADVMTVSTQSLADYYKNLCPVPIKVIENAFNDYSYTFQKPSKKSKFINWRGSITHRDDLLSCSKDIFSLSQSYREWTWSFLGGDPWYIANHIENAYVSKQLDIIAYNKLTEEFHPEIQMVPLEFSDFNSAKSNIAWIESTSMGAATIAPNLPEFDRPGVIRYSEETGNFGYYLEKMIKSQSFREENYLASFEYVKENLMLSEVNKKRLQIVEEIV